MNENSLPGLDILIPLRWLLIIAAVFALAFRRLLWIRVVCVVLALVSVVFGSIRVDVSPRMAVDRLQREGKPWSEAFRDGSLYTLIYVGTSIPTFLLASIVLATLALVPIKRRSTNESSRNALTRCREPLRGR
jgi:hypothetical protein